MKKQAIILATAVLLAGISMSSCSPRCKGGGWYNDRNLGYVPVKEQQCESHLNRENDE